MQLRMKPTKKKENTGYAVWTCSLLPWNKPLDQAMPEANIWTNLII